MILSKNSSVQPRVFHFFWVLIVFFMFAIALLLCLFYLTYKSESQVLREQLFVQRNLLDARIKTLLKAHKKLGETLHPITMTKLQNREGHFFQKRFGKVFMRLRAPHDENESWMKRWAKQLSSVEKFLEENKKVDQVYFIGPSFLLFAPFSLYSTPGVSQYVQERLDAYDYDLLTHFVSAFSGWHEIQVRSETPSIRYTYPMYHAGQLEGFHTLHLGASFFKSAMEGLKIPVGQLCTLGAKGSVLAVKTAKGFQKTRAIPKIVRTDTGRMGINPDTLFKAVHQHTQIYVLPLKRAPFRIVFFVGRSELIRWAIVNGCVHLVRDGTIFLFLFLFLVVWFCFYTIRTHFSCPTGALLNHLNQERLGIYKKSGKGSTWIAWHALVSSYFREKRNQVLMLQQQLKEKKGDLDRLMGYLKLNQQQLAAQEKLVTIGSLAIGAGLKIDSALQEVKILMAQKNTRIPTTQVLLSDIQSLLRRTLVASTRQEDAKVLDMSELAKQYTELFYLSFLKQHPLSPMTLNVTLPDKPILFEGVSHHVGAVLYSLCNHSARSALSLYETTESDDKVAEVNLTLTQGANTLLLTISDNGVPAHFDVQEERKIEENASYATHTLSLPSALAVIEEYDGTLRTEEGEKNTLHLTLPLYKEHHEAV